MTATFIPQGAFSFNPRMLLNEELDMDLEEADESTATSSIKGFKYKTSKQDSF